MAFDHVATRCGADNSSHAVSIVLNGMIWVKRDLLIQRKRGQSKVPLAAADAGMLSHSSQASMGERGGAVLR